MFEICDVKTKFKLENAKQQLNQEIAKFVTYLNNLYSQLKNLISNNQKISVTFELNYKLVEFVRFNSKSKTTKTRLFDRIN